MSSATGEYLLSPALSNEVFSVHSGSCSNASVEENGSVSYTPGGSKILDAMRDWSEIEALDLGTEDFRKCTVVSGAQRRRRKSKASISTNLSTKRRKRMVQSPVLSPSSSKTRKNQTSKSAPRLQLSRSTPKAEMFTSEDLTGLRKKFSSSTAPHMSLTWLAQECIGPFGARMSPSSEAGVCKAFGAPIVLATCGGKAFGEPVASETGARKAFGRPSALEPCVAELLAIPAYQKLASAKLLARPAYSELAPAKLLARPSY